MYGENILSDSKRFLCAFLTNQIARLSPKFYLHLTAQTGRGVDSEIPEQIAEYFLNCFMDYFKILGICPEEITSYLTGKRILEYGPGNIPGVALLMLAYGAADVICVDRFPMISFSSKNVSVLKYLLEKLPATAKQKVDYCFIKTGDITSGISPKFLQYSIQPSGLSQLNQEIDLIISRAVLEHTNNLDASFFDMHRALKDKGVAIHEVDLKSHGLHQKNILDFLTWPDPLWRLMYSCKGMPNRWRVDYYRQSLINSGLRLKLLEPKEMADLDIVEEIRPFLAKPFKNISDEDLSWLSFWLVVEKNNTYA